MSINVPDEKAKAVIDALEREMLDKLATKADLAHLQAITRNDLAHVKDLMSADMAALRQGLSADMKSLRQEVSADMKALRQDVSADMAALNDTTSMNLARVEERVTASMKTGFAELETRLTVRLGTMMGAMFLAAAAMIGTVQFFR